jgi:hypothetical protein
VNNPLFKSEIGNIYEEEEKFYAKLGLERLIERGHL